MVYYCILQPSDVGSFPGSGLELVYIRGREPEGLRSSHSLFENNKYSVGQILRNDIDGLNSVIGKLYTVWNPMQTISMGLLTLCQEWLFHPPPTPPSFILLIFFNPCYTFPT